ncbi:MAG TPA: DUF294 nucleotidyltransferase-like domain-containing protein [Longimicrobium sp.]|jgi:predicted nucleotidyltransferase|nr:DUF294 nucleotidyltransferase-like domain-containing protein [Longimicrobium sp.]
MSEQLALLNAPSEVVQLRERLGADWPSITKARADALTVIDRLQAGLGGHVPPDTSFVVYGSLARREFTAGSDLDWTLLLDGPSDPAHREAEILLRRRLEELEFKEPNPVGTFGRLTVSHDLIHKIGGEDDTNRNTTQRILLLLESIPIGDAPAYTGVVRNVLRRYIEEDLLGPGDSPYRVPRFLQNDVARYWRTMTVDFAHKRRLRGSGWALRTAKLRMSRKLIYAAGLLSCFSCETEFVAQARGSGRADTPLVVGHLEALVRKTPLDIVARFVLQYFGELSGCARDLFGAYDAFLSMLNDARREHLDGLSADVAGEDPVYEEARAMGQRFQDALTRMFFESDTPLPELTKRYGVF